MGDIVDNTAKSFTNLASGGGGLGGVAGSLGGQAMNFLGEGGLDITGAGATRAAIEAQRQAAAEANATQKYMYDTTRSDLQPWREAGVSALSSLQNPDFQKTFTMADFQADPGYQFRMNEGMKAIERSAAARGGLGSGATLKSLTRYGQDYASNEFDKSYNRYNNNATTRFNRLSALAGIGQTGQAETNAVGANYANNVSANQIGMGNAIASANIAQANRVAGLVTGGASAAGTAYGRGGVAASDIRVKKDIKPIPHEDLIEMKRHLKAYSFKYKNKKYGDGEYVGVMAQDLEKSKLGKSLVFEDANGVKQIDLKRVMCLFLATLAEG